MLGGRKVFFSWASHCPVSCFQFDFWNSGIEFPISYCTSFLLKAKYYFFNREKSQLGGWGRVQYCTIAQLLPLNNKMGVGGKMKYWSFSSGSFLCWHACPYQLGIHGEKKRKILLEETPLLQLITHYIY